MICQLCQKKFNCWVEKGKGICWCFMYPPLEDTLPNKDICICEPCYERKVKQQNVSRRSENNLHKRKTRPSK
jgi:hypothetical protein